MKATLLAFGIALISATTVNAQTTPTPTPTLAGPSHDCILSTDANAWTSIGLTADQTKQVEAIQASCKNECDAMMKEKGAVDKSATIDKHEAQIKAALTADQYAKWVAWCKERPAKTELVK